MPGRRRRTFFAALIGTATPNTVYTQQAAKPACQQDIAVNFSHLLLAQLPRTQFAHTSCQTRMPRRHRRTFFAAPIGTATPNTIYTQQAAKPACQEDIAVHFSQLLLAQLPQTQFTHSKLPNPNARKTSPYIFRSSYWHSYPEHSLHTASCQTRMPGRHHRVLETLSTGRAASLSRGSEYCACHTMKSRGPAATRRASTLSRGSEYCACHTERSRGPAATGHAASLSRGSEYCACHTESSRGPAATGRAASLSRGSEYCAYHTEKPL